MIGLSLVARLLSCALVAGIALSLPHVADAKTYTVWSCRGPAGEPLSTAAWETRTVNAAAGDVAFADTCAEGGSLRVSLAPGRGFDAAVVGMAAFSAPPGTRIVDYRLWRSLAVAPPQFLRAFDYGAAIAESNGGASVPRGCSTMSSTCRSAGDPGDPLAPVNEFTHDGLPLDALGLQVSCERSWCQAPSGTPARAELYRARVVVDDSLPPAVAQLFGSVLEGPVPAGPATLTVAASDAGAGVASVSLSIDGGATRTAAAAHPACREPYVVAAPCPGTVTESFSIDGAALTPGRHSVSGTVSDAAGNVTGWGPVDFEVRRPDAPVTPAPPAPVTSIAPAAHVPTGVVNGGPAARLRLAKRSVVHAPGKPARLTGTLRTPQGEPIANARLQLTSFDLGVEDAERRRLAPVATDARGRFTAIVRRDGAQRVTVAFAADPAAEPTASVSATVRTRLSLTAAPDRGWLLKGRTLTLSGRLRGAGASGRGAIIRVESIVNGRWTPVGVARARADGRYRWRYRFVHLTRDTTFSFRALVEQTPGWPWPSVRSARLRVNVDIT